MRRHDSVHQPRDVPLPSNSSRIVHLVRRLRDAPEHFGYRWSANLAASGQLDLSDEPLGTGHHHAHATTSGRSRAKRLSMAPP